MGIPKISLKSVELAKPASTESQLPPELWEQFEKEFERLCKAQKEGVEDPLRA